MDCIEGMRQFPDKYFDLAVVDPVYGDVTRGGYMSNSDSKNKKARPIQYHTSIWSQEKTGKDYFKELFRVSKNQVIWGGNYFTDYLPVSQCWLCWDKKKTAGFADFELAWTSYNRASRIFRYMWNGMLQENMGNKEHRIHPTQKPVDLYKWILNMFAEQGYKILDTHVGSASSLVACRNLHLDYVGFEIDDVYYKDAKERLEREEAQVDIYDLLGE